MCNIGPYSSLLNAEELEYAKTRLKTFGLELSNTQQTLCTGRANLQCSAKCLGAISLVRLWGSWGQPYQLLQVIFFFSVKNKLIISWGRGRVEYLKIFSFVLLHLNQLMTIACKWKKKMGVEVGMYTYELMH